MSDNWVVQNLENALNTWNEKLRCLSRSVCRKSITRTACITGRMLSAKI